MLADFAVRVENTRGRHYPQAPHPFRNDFQRDRDRIKHSRDYDAAKFPELKEYLLDQRPPLEAQIIDLTDEIGYNTADLDDGWEAEILTLEQIRGGVPVFDRLFRETEKANPQASEKL